MLLFSTVCKCNLTPRQRVNVYTATWRKWHFEALDIQGSSILRTDMIENFGNMKQVAYLDPRFLLLILHKIGVNNSLDVLPHLGCLITMATLRKRQAPPHSQDNRSYNNRAWVPVASPMPALLRLISVIFYVVDSVCIIYIQTQPHCSCRWPHQQCRGVGLQDHLNWLTATIVWPWHCTLTLCSWTVGNG